MLTIDDQIIGVFGYGKTGLSAVRYLLRKKKSVVVFDTRTPPAKSEKIPGVEYNWEVTDWVRSDISTLIVSPGLRLDLPVLQKAKAKGVSIESDIDLFFHDVGDKPVFGITGTNGKSTVTTMLAHVFSENGYNCKCGGNLGTPALDLLNLDSEIYVLELSSFQLERLREYQFECAAILNISEDHLDHHKSMGDYISSKQKIFSNAKKCVFNRDDDKTYPKTTKQIASFGRGPQVTEFDWAVEDGPLGRFVTCNREKIIELGNLPPAGYQSDLNLLCVLAMASDYVQPEEAVMALTTYQGLDHRYKEVLKLNEIAFINDSKATNAGALISALDNFSKQNVILIAGGDSKGVDFEPLSSAFVGKVKCLIAMGKNGADIAGIAQTLEIKTIFVMSIEEAVKVAHEDAEPGDTVLLSPACASFDMFENFEDRGKRFEKAVFALAGLGV